jgi:hypothetical protein
VIHPAPVILEPQPLVEPQRRDEVESDPAPRSSHYPPVGDAA